MKLNQYKEKKNNKKLLIIIGVVLLFAGGIIMEKTFANFKVQKSFKVMEGNFIYEGKGDITLAFYQDNQPVEKLPTLEKGYIYERSECNNGASIEWNNSKWAPLVTNLTMSKTKCDIYFKKGSLSGSTSSDYNALADLINKKEGQLIYDLTNDNNLRFVGADPDNYVSFNNDEYIWKGYNSSSNYKYFNSSEECKSDGSYHYSCEQVPAWRIIGVMNNIEDENGNMGSHLKLIRSRIGEYSWDSSESSVNNGAGVNEWSEADIQKVLNDNYYNKKAGGICYGGSNEIIKECPDWESIGLNDDARNMVSKVKWNTGTIPFDYNDRNNKDFLTPFYMYNVERSMYNGKLCEQGHNYCTDEVERTSSWTGYVGLMYPSDFGFATNGGGSEDKRKICLKTSMSANSTISNWTSSNYSSYCGDRNWLNADYTSNVRIVMATITSVPYYGSGYYLFSIESYGISEYIVSSTPQIFPVVYLNSNVKIEPNDASDYGSKTNPYRLIT